MFALQLKKTLINHHSLRLKMPINATPEYQKAEQAYTSARTVEDRLKALQNMLTLAPKHKGSEKLVAGIKTKISKLKGLLEKEKKQKKGKGKKTSIKKEGAAQVTLVGTTNTGKSTLLNKLTGAKVYIAPYPFTTKKPEVGILDHKGIKLQIIEIPSIVENFMETEQGPSFLNIINQADLIVIFFNNPKEKGLLDKELSDITVKKIIFDKLENFDEKIWRALDLIKVYTKQPGKKPDYPPIALKKESAVRDLALHIHKDFIKKFRFARIWGSSARFPGQEVGLNHRLYDDDIVELHME